MGGESQTQVILPFFIDMDVFIPNEILKLKDLNITEKVVLAIYKYYTEQGKYKCCSLSKPQIANELGISVDYMKDIKKHLNELGYIRTDGGIRVIYLGVQEGDITPTQVGTITPSGEMQVGDITPSGGGYNTQGGVIEHPVVGDITPSQWGIEHPHKKEKEEKKDKKEKKWVTNIKLLFANLPKDYQTKERVSYIKDNYMDKLNEVDLNEGGILDTWVVNIKNILNKVYTQDFIIEKEEPRNNTIDVL